MSSHPIFITGATGYLGRALIAALLARDHSVRALVHEESRSRVPAGAETVIGDALVHLIGTPHPSPAKAASFRAVDLVSVDAALAASSAAAVRDFVYVSAPPGRRR